MTITSAPAPAAYPHQQLKDKFFSPVAQEIQSAHIHYSLFRDLQKKVRGYRVEYNNAPAFWSLTMNAHLVSAIAGLCRIYDPHEKSLTLAGLLETLRDSANTPWIAPSETSTTRKIPTAARFKRDIQSLGYNDPLAKKLLWQRNNLYAHKSRKHILNGGVGLTGNTLTHSELNRLLDRSKRVVNHYGSIYLGNTWTMKIVGHGDYMHVLNALKAWTKQYDANLKAEIQEMRRQAKIRKRGGKPD